MADEHGIKSQDLPSAYIYGLLALAFLFLVLGGPLIIAFVRDVLRLSAETTLLALMSVTITIFLILLMPPLLILTEAFYSRSKKRKFRALNVIVMVGILVLAVAIMDAYSLAIGLIFPRLSFTNEPFVGLAGLVLGLMIGLPVLTIALTSRIPRVRKYFKTMF